MQEWAVGTSPGSGSGRPCLGKADQLVHHPSFRKSSNTAHTLLPGTGVESAPPSHSPKTLFSEVGDFFLVSSNITADGDCSHEIKRRLLLGRKAMTNLESILKIRDVILPTKVRLVKAMGFPVVMYGCESWTIKKAACRRIDAFELWC